MNKSELIAAIADRTSQSKNKVEEMLTACTDIIQEVVAAGDKAAIMGFGVFERMEVKPRVGRNPQTGALLKLDGGYRPKFSAGATFKQRVTEAAK
ncbi:HU family DNA-binding protein [Aromatoleum evansii]|jgi:DNA-binding protein HU-beta|uniref:HU family DNA-binding protein n=1 Tax=Aromatoleum evansii TaxID=59406 RepID=UPI00145D3BB7|nr:HU family DNA-binding protein [Aromatoleum evansii]NMG29559.1 DNA-binding protein [Aromatoleum evansii]